MGKTSSAKRRRSDQRSNKVHGKKRNFRGNQHTKKDVFTPEENDVDHIYVSAFSKKIKQSIKDNDLNEHRTNVEGCSTPKEPSSTATLPNHLHDIDKVNDDTFPSCYLLIDTSMLFSLLSLLTCCPECQSRGIDLKIDPAKKKGLSILLEVKCKYCSWENNSYTKPSSFK